MGKSYCAVNAKYYKNSNIEEIGHVLRQMAVNVNAIEGLTYQNFGQSFGDVNLKEHYKNRLDDAKLANKYALQENSNTFIDSVLIFNHKLFNKCLEEGKKEEIEQATKDFMFDFKDEFGFEPIGFEFHLDEGTEIDLDVYDKLTEEEKAEYEEAEPDNLGSNYVKKNIHAHAIFLNYDFDKNKSCLRNMTKKNWSYSQDLLHKHFKKFGFERGEKKLTNKQDHMHKSDYIRELALKTNELIEEQTIALNDKNELLDEIIKHQETLNKFDNLSDYAENIKNAVFTFKERNTKVFVEILKLPFIEKIIQPVIDIYEAITQKHDELDRQENKLEEIEKVEIVKLSNEEQKEKNELAEKEIIRKKEEIKKNNQRRKYGRKKPTEMKNPNAAPRPNGF